MHAMRSQYFIKFFVVLVCGGGEISITFALKVGQLEMNEECFSVRLHRALAYHLMEGGVAHSHKPQSTAKTHNFLIIIFFEKYSSG